MEQEANNNLYYVKLNFWNDIGDKELECKFYAFASSLTTLMYRIENDYHDINSIKVKIINPMCGSSDFLYVDDLTWDERHKIEQCNKY